MLGHFKGLLHPPALIVTSRLADERRWAEALNLGAWDVLAKPLDRREVLRSVRAACQYRRNPIKISVGGDDGDEDRQLRGDAPHAA